MAEIYILVEVKNGIVENVQGSMDYNEMKTQLDRARLEMNVGVDDVELNTVEFEVI